MILPPVIEWTHRLSTLSNGSVSQEISSQILESLGLTPVIDWLYELDGKEPSRKECEEKFRHIFPNQTMGEFNAVEELEDEDIFKDSESDEFNEDDT